MKSFDIDKLWMHLAWMLPRRLAYWCAIRVAAHGTLGQYKGQIVPDLTVMDALERWSKVKD